MMRKNFILELQQLLYSIGEVEGMITGEEAEEILDKAASSLSNGEDLIPETTDRAALHLDAAHALRRFS
jgi:hypothetical protein